MMGNKKVRLKIDHVEVEVEKGKMILEAAERAGIRIPTLCHDRRLVPFGACRLCVVEQKGRSELQLACFTPAREGMEIITQSPEIFESRRLQLQFILLNHPMICPRCEKEGECALQNLVYEYGAEETRLPWERIPFPVDNLSPLLQRDPNKCILCGRCVRICDEVQGIGELSFTGRGIRSSIGTDFQRPLDCEFCGQCLDTCPVGAITSDCFHYGAKVWELRETTTPCPYCACGCLLTIGSKDGEIKRLFSDPGSGPNDGNLCVKGRFGWDFIDHPERIRSPLLRVNGSFREASWEEALRFVSEEIEETRAHFGPDAIAAVVSSRLTNEEHYLFGKLFREAIGTDQVFHGGDGACQGLAEGLLKTLGAGASTNSIREIRKADCILVIGADPAATHPIIRNEIHLAIRQNRAQLIVAGSSDIGLSRATEISPLLPPAIVLIGRPGMEVPLLNAMAKTILKEGLEDKGFIEEKTEGIEGIRRTIASREAQGFGKLPEAEEQTVEKAARAYAKAKKAMILIGSGSWSHPFQEEVAIASSNLALLTGHIGKESSGILLLLEKSNSQGAIDSGIFPEGKDRGAKRLYQKAVAREVKALHLVGEDPLAVSSDSEQLREAFKGLRLLVVQDLFMTETAKMADVLLPACAFVEKTGTYTNLERRIQRLNPVRPPLGQSKSDFEIFLQLLRLFEHPVPGENEEAIFEALKSVLPNYRDVKDGEQWPKGSSYLSFAGFPGGKAKLVPVEGPGPLPKAEGYPFYLVQRPSLFRSGSLSLKSEALGWVSEEPRLEINREDGQRLQIADGETVEVSSGGRSLRLKLKYSARPAPGVVMAPYPCPLVDEGGIASVKITGAAKRNLGN